MEKKRAIIGVVLAFLMLAMIAVIVVNKDNIFNNEVVITYPDRCVEKFINGELVTPECTTGRDIMEKQRNGEYVKNPITSGEIPAWEITIPE